MRLSSSFATARMVDDAVDARARSGVERVSAVRGIAGEWDALADAVGAPPWARPGWIEIWSRCFGRRAEAMVLRRDGVLLAVAPVTRGRLSGVVAAANGHTPRYVVLAADADADEALVRGIVEQEGSLRISHMHQGVADRLCRALDVWGGQASVRTLGESPYIDLSSSTWAEYRRTIWNRARSIERELRRLGRRHGPVTVVDIRTGAELDRYIEVGLELEGSGWKRREGTAIVSQRETAAFYRELCRWATRSGFLRLSFLCAGRRAIAFDLSLESTLKGGYDARYRSYGPGVMLTYETVRRLFDEGATSYELLGQSEAFKQSFTSAGDKQAALYAAAAGARGLVGRAAFGLQVGGRARIKPIGTPLAYRYRRVRLGGGDATDKSHKVKV
jgi:CelD/BcsL family acetyltransferase involved in cellulose biosynthesis